MNNVAYPVQVVESHENLPSDLADYGNWNTFIIVLLYQRQKIFPEDFEGHDRVLSIRPVMEELVEHLQVVSVLAANFKIRVFVVIAH